MKASGFTLIEMLVSIGILGIITGMMLANFHGGQQSSELRFAVETVTNRLRTTQTYAFGGRLVSVCSGGSQANQVCEPGKIPAISCTGGGSCQRRAVPGYGLRFQVNQKVATVFYDVNGNNIYDAGEDAGTAPFVQSGTVTLSGANIGLPIDVLFQSPDAKVKINGADAPDLLQLNFTQTASGKIRHVMVYRIAGKIEHD